MLENIQRTSNPVASMIKSFWILVEIHVRGANISRYPWVADAVICFRLRLHPPCPMSGRTAKCIGRRMLVMLHIKKSSPTLLSEVCGCSGGHPHVFGVDENRESICMMRIRRNMKAERITKHVSTTSLLDMIFDTNLGLGNGIYPLSKIHVLIMIDLPMMDILDIT